MKENGSESGFISLWALIVACFVFGIGLALSAYFGNMGRMSAEYVIETRLRFAAESAAEHAAQELEKAGSAGSLAYAAEYNVAYPEEHYHCTVKAQEIGGRLIITAIAYRVEKASAKDWDRHKVRRAVLKQNGEGYVWDGWLEQ